MNEHFITKLKEHDYSVYQLAKMSGVPYSTVSELKNCKTSINKCSSATVMRLAAALGVRADDILDEILYLDGVSGSYNGISYRWKTDTTSKLYFRYDDTDVEIDIGEKYNVPEFMSYYAIVAGWRVQNYIDDINWQKRMSAVMQEAMK